MNSESMHESMADHPAFAAAAERPAIDGELFDVVVVGGGPSGATAAHDLACAGRKVLMLDRAWRTKPCGGAVPPQLLRDFSIPQSLLVARVNVARVI